jgi:hypothetical protein
MRRFRSLLVAATISLAGLTSGLGSPVTVMMAAGCESNHITIYVNSNGVGTGQSFCLDLGPNPSNLGAISGPCSGTWNDCVSSVRVTVGATQCYATYQAANWSNLMQKYWGSIGPDVMFNVSPNNVMSSFKQYSKSPTTPAGNC